MNLPLPKALSLLLALLGLVVELPAAPFNVPVSGVAGSGVSDATLVTASNAVRFPNDLTHQLPTNQFPELQSRIAAGKPLRIVGMGDSVGYQTAQQMWEAMRHYFGTAGGAIADGNNFGYSTSGTTVTNRAADTNWFAGHYDIANTGFIDTTNHFNPIRPNGVVFANRLEAYYVQCTNTGAGSGFNLLISTNGGAFAVSNSVQTISATLTGRVATVNIMPGWYQARLQCTNGYVKVIGLALYNTNSAGVRPSILAGSGIDLAAIASVSNSITRPIMKALEPDLLLIESTKDSATSFALSLGTMETNFLSALTNTDVIYLGTPPIDEVTWGAFDYTNQNAIMRTAAQTYGRRFFDQSVMSGTFSNMSWHGWTGDGIHRSNNLDRIFASALLATAKVGNQYESGALGFSANPNFYTATQTFGSNIMIRGLSVWQDETLGGYRGVVSMSGGNLRLGLDVDGAGTFYRLQLNGGFGGLPEPVVYGFGFGRDGARWQLYGTNSSLHGVTTNAHGEVVGVPGVTGLAVLTNVLTATAALDFPSTGAQTDTNLTITVAGAAAGDTVELGVPTASLTAGTCYTAWASNGVVYVRLLNASSTAKDPASGTFRAVVRKWQ